MGISLDKMLATKTRFLTRQIRFNSATSTAVPRVGKPAPAFKQDAMQNGEFKSVQLSDFKGKWLYLMYYPLDFTFACRKFANSLA